MLTRTVRVLIIDDTATIRAVIRAALSADPRLCVVGEARDPYEARELIKALSPDVITLDVEMPRMNGLEFLARLMRLRPLPVVMVSTRTTEQSAAAVRALSLGAVDCVDVARLRTSDEVRRRLVETLVAAGSARPGAAGPRRVAEATPVPGPHRAWNGRIVVIGSSTGGVDALERVLAPFPADCPPTLIAQHMPASFLESFARRLDDALPPKVAIAADGVPLAHGLVLLGGGGARHLAVAAPSPGRTVLPPADPGDVYVPTIDRLFASAAAFGRRAVGVILTGMGRDGATGLLAMRQAGAHTIAQSAETCVVDGMPRAAREAGAAIESVPLDRIGQRILELCTRSEGALQ